MGLQLEFGMNERMAVELIYQNIKTSVSYAGLSQQYKGNCGINYAMLGVTH